MTYSSWKWTVLLPLLTKPGLFVFLGGVVSSLTILPFLYSQEVVQWRGSINVIHEMGEFYDADNSVGDITPSNYTLLPSQYTEVQVKTLIFSKPGNLQECNLKLLNYLNTIEKIQHKKIPVVLTKVCSNRGFAIGRFADDDTLISILPIHDKRYNLAGVKMRKSSIVNKPTFLQVIVNFSITWPALVIIMLSMGISYLLSLIVGGYLKALNIYASMDGLTGCLRREAFYEKATYEFKNAKKKDLPFSVLVIDIDHLREVNNTYGHAKGDVAISLSAKSILKCLRNKDFVGRVGGDEFIVILRNTKLSDALLVANRIRQAVKEIKLDDLSLSVSIGISRYEKNDATLQELISKADTNLYVAKRQRNEVFFDNETVD